MVLFAFKSRKIASGLRERLEVTDKINIFLGVEVSSVVRLLLCNT